MKNDKLEVVGGKIWGIFVLVISVPLMTAAVMCVLFADRIDAVVKGDKKVKKVTVVFGVGVLLICALAIAVSILASTSKSGIPVYQSFPPGLGLITHLY